MILGLLFISTGCDKGQAVEELDLIDFQDTELTKSSISSIDELNEFNVWGFWNSTPVDPSICIFDGTKVWKTAEQEWKYEGKKYWLIGNYDFYAVYPGLAKSCYQLTAEEEVVIINGFNLAEAQEDLMFARELRTYPFMPGETKYVSLRFRHLLSLLSVKMKKEGAETIYLDEIRLYNLPVEGDCRILLGTDDWSARWSVKKERSTSDKPSASWIKSLSSYGEHIEIMNSYQTVIEPFLTLPLSLQSDYPLVIDIRCTTGSGRKIGIQKLLKKMEFRSGEKYNLSMTIDKSGNIILDMVDSRPWGTALAGSVILPV